MIRQGDVLLRKLEALPVEARPVEGEGAGEGPFVLAAGEATGHAHVAEAPGAGLYRVRVPSGGERRYLVVASEATVRHEEHAPVSLAPGVWEVLTQRAYEPERPRRVLD